MILKVKGIIDLFLVEFNRAASLTFSSCFQHLLQLRQAQTHRAESRQLT